MRASEPHPEYQAFIAETEDAPAFHQMGVEASREVSADVFAVDESTPVGEVQDRTIDGPGGDLDIRIYLPEGEGPFPVAVYFHGGGFVSGNLESHDEFCRDLTNATGAAFVAVDYRLAPEDPYPAAVDDAYAATEWAAANAEEFGGDADRLAVVGDSAGGNLAAAVALRARDEGSPSIDLQVLMYPTVAQHGETWPSHEENAEGYFITARDLEWFQEQYFADASDAEEPYASPILADDLSGLPPAIIATGGFDPLRDEGVEYAERLEDAGVDVTHIHYEGAIHVFVQMAAAPFEFDRSKEAFDDVVEAINAQLT